MKEIKLLEKEIDWCLEHPARNLSKDFQKGFVFGLKQAINLLTSKSSFEIPVSPSNEVKESK